MQAETKLLTMMFCKTIQEYDAGREAELLTGDPVDQAFKDGSKPRRLDSCKSCSQLVQARMPIHECVELRKVYIDPQ
jgi:hypothetical protein